MPTHAAFLRGVNLGPNRRVGAAQLRSAFEELGFDEVDAFRSSGNVVFAAGREAKDRLKSRIAQGLADALGFDVEVFLRTGSELGAIAAHDPFSPAQVEASKGKLQVLLLAAKPSAATRRKVLALATNEDLLAFGDRELYWLPSGGTRDATLDQRAIGKLLGSATQRTMGTIELMAAKYFE